MRLKLDKPYESIHTLDPCELPDFAVLMGRNGAGKTQLLAGITDRQILGAWHESDTIEKYEIGTFRPHSSGRAVYAASLFAESTAQRYLVGTGGQSASALARDIFDETVERYGLAPRTQGRQEFEATIRSSLGAPDFEPVGVVHVSFAASGLDDAERAVERYTREVAKRVVGPLALKSENRRGRRSQRRPNSYNNDPAVLVSMAMKLSGKLAHEIDRNDILRAAHYEGDTISNTLSQAFARYKAEQYSWAITESERGRGDVGSLIDAYRRHNTPPWETLREVLANMRGAAGCEDVFDFDFSDPEADRLNHANHTQYSF